MVRLGGNLFLDIFPKDVHIAGKFADLDLTSSAFGGIPTHTFFRYWIKGDILLLAPLDDEWLSRNLTTGEIQIPHELFGPDDTVVLTASTGDLQKLVLAHAENPEAFPMFLGLRRQK